MTPDQGQTTQGAQQGGFIPGPFGGQVPVPPKTPDQTSDLPSFQFSKDDFQSTTQVDNTNEDNTNEIVDPFANGVASLAINNTGPTTEDIVIEGNLADEGSIPTAIIEEDNKINTIESPIIMETNTPSFELPETQSESHEEKTSNNQINKGKDNIEINSSDFTLPPVEVTPSSEGVSEISFDLPISKNNHNNISETTITETDVEETIGQEDLSFVLPSADNTNIAAGITNTTTTNTTIVENDEINKVDKKEGDYQTEAINNSGDENSNNNSYITSVDNNTEIIQQDQEIVVDQEENNTNRENEVEEQPIVTPAGVNESPNKEITDNTNPLIEEYTTFVRELNSLLQFRNSSEASILAHRTDEDEIQYNFHQENNSITVKRNYIKFSDNNPEEQLLSFNNDDGLQVSLNDDSIAHYGKEEEDSDITYYLKDKLNKFITIITDEKTKEEKRFKEEKQKKKIKIEVLRSF